MCECVICEETVKSGNVCKDCEDTAWYEYRLGEEAEAEWREAHGYSQCPYCDNVHRAGATCSCADIKAQGRFSYLYRMDEGGWIPF